MLPQRTMHTVEVAGVEAILRLRPCRAAVEIAEAHCAHQCHGACAAPPHARRSSRSNVSARPGGQRAAPCTIFDARLPALVATCLLAHHFGGAASVQQNASYTTQATQCCRDHLASYCVTTYLCANRLVRVPTLATQGEQTMRRNAKQAAQKQGRRGEMRHINKRD